MCVGHGPLPVVQGERETQLACAAPLQRSTGQQEAIGL